MCLVILASMLLMVVSAVWIDHVTQSRYAALNALSADNTVELLYTISHLLGSKYACY